MLPRTNEVERKKAEILTVGIPQDMVNVVATNMDVEALAETSVADLVRADLVRADGTSAH